MAVESSVSVRREKKGFIIPGIPIVGKPIAADIKTDLQGKADTIQWPQECANCGGLAQKIDMFTETTMLKGTGPVQASVAVVFKGIPYCNVCYPKIKNAQNISFWQLVVTGLVGVGLSIYSVNYAGNNPISFDLGGGLSMESIPCGGLIILSFLVAYALSWLVVRLPAAILLKGKVAKPVKGSLEDNDTGGSRSVNLVLSIPNEEYAAKFAQLNGL